MVQFSAPVVQLDAVVNLLRALLAHPGIKVSTTLVATLDAVLAVPAALVIRRYPSRDVRNDVEYAMKDIAPIT